jgi:hypothetical protein
VTEAKNRKEVSMEDTPSIAEIIPEMSDTLSAYTQNISPPSPSLLESFPFLSEDLPWPGGMDLSAWPPHNLPTTPQSTVWLDPAVLESMTRLSKGTEPHIIPESVAIVTDDEQLLRLLAMQKTLVHLLQVLRSREKMQQSSFHPPLSDIIDDAYGITGELVDIVPDLAHVSAEERNRTTVDIRSPPRPDLLGGPLVIPQPDVATILLVLSCYSTLISIYSLLADLLQNHLSLTPSGEESVRSPESSDLPSSPDNVALLPLPIISIGRLKLALPQSDIAGIHLRVIPTILHRLKKAMEVGAARLYHSTSPGNTGVEERAPGSGKLEPLASFIHIALSGLELQNVTIEGLR